MRKQILAIAASVILVPSLALADGKEYKGDLGRHGGIHFNGPVEITSLATLKAIKLGEQHAVVEGTIVRQLQDDKFLFTDGKDEMVVELDDDIRLNQTIDATTKLRMFGEYEAWDEELEVDHVVVL